MNITDYLVSKTTLLVPQPEVTPTPPGYQMYNSGGVEIEVAEFLYSFVKMVKPTQILETGTHLGVSTAYMAQALLENKKGVINTCEVISSLQQQAIQLWNQLGLMKQIHAFLKPSLSLEVNQAVMFDMLFLDSEPQLRFDELLKFWNYVPAGGFIITHDLHPSMGHHGETYHGTYDWPYGDFRPKLGYLFKDKQVQYMHFATPRGLTVMQKTDPSWEIVKYLAGE